MGRIKLPDTFLGMKRDDSAPEVAMMRRQTGAVTEGDPNKHVLVTSYKGGSFGENHVLVVAVESDVPFSEEDRADAQADMNDGSTQVPGMKVTHGEVKDADPGPLGGVMKCKVVITKIDKSDAVAGDVFNAPTCAWLDGNTYVTFSDGSGSTGLDLAKTADHARQFRAQAETRR